MYKLSKFNFWVENDIEELLLYNTASKSEHFLKIKKDYKELVLNVLNGHEVIEVLPDQITSKLASGGFIIPEDVDESLKLKTTYLDYVADSTLSLIILPTEKCNFRCKYCYESFPDSIMEPDTQDALINFLSKNLSRYKGLHISWFGGEPLLAKNIILSLSDRIINLCKQHRKTYTASMTTNAYLLDVQTFRELLKAKILYYQITIDGLAYTHNNQRPLINGSPTFEHIIANLEAIRDEVHSHTFRITIRTNFSKSMLDTIPQYKQFFGSRFGNDNRFQFFFRPVMDWGGDRVKEFYDSILEVSLMSEIYRITMESEPRLHFIYEDFLYPGAGVCDAAKQNHYVVRPNGDIYKCTCDFQKFPQAKIGELSKEGGFILDFFQTAEWLCNFSTCTNENCFFSPNCFRDFCPSHRIFYKNSQKRCPLEKENLPMTLLLLDKENHAFQEALP